MGSCGNGLRPPEQGEVAPEELFEDVQGTDHGALYPGIAREDAQDDAGDGEEHFCAFTDRQQESVRILWCDRS